MAVDGREEYAGAHTSLCTADMPLPVVLDSMSVSCWATQMYVRTYVLAYISSKLKNDTQGDDSTNGFLCSPKTECHTES